MQKINWWDHDVNKETFPLPISVIEDNSKWTACFNRDTESVLGPEIHAVCGGDTKGEAIEKLFLIVRMTLRYEKECRLNYQRFVPFRKGPWRSIGGRWFTIFGIHVYFRYGNGMKGGRYIPFTKLNISIHSEWKTYKNWKTEKKNKKINPWQIKDQ